VGFITIIVRKRRRGVVEEEEITELSRKCLIKTNIRLGSQHLDSYQTLCKLLLIRRLKTILLTITPKSYVPIHIQPGRDVSREIVRSEYYTLEPQLPVRLDSRLEDVVINVHKRAGKAQFA